MNIFGALLSLAITAMLLIAFRPVALQLGLVDEPGGRKRHDSRVPVVGGIAVLLGSTVGSVFFWLPGFWNTAVLSMWLLVSVGAIDDRFDLPPSVRLISQAVAAMLAVFAAGVLIADLGTTLIFPVSLGLFAPLFTVLAIMAVINGFNLIDGIDGLAGGAALLSLLALAWLGAAAGITELAIVLAAAVTGFLLFNLPLRINRRVRVFMGDAGSTALGFAIACIGIVICQSESAAVAPAVGLWIVALPLYELIAAIVRRVNDGTSPWAADDRHLHHSLLARGISPRRALAFLLMLSGAFAAIGVAGHLASAPDALMFAGWIAGGIAYYRVTRRPHPVAKWVYDWKQSKSLDVPFVETVVLGSNGRDHSR